MQQTRPSTLSLQQDLSRTISLALDGRRDLRLSTPATLMQIKATSRGRVENITTKRRNGVQQRLHLAGTT